MEPSPEAKKEAFIKVDLGKDYSVETLMNHIKGEVRSGKLRGHKDIVSVNGIEGVSGWQILNELRTEMEAQQLGAQMVIVKTHTLDVRVAGFKPMQTLDMVRQYRGGNGRELFAFWYEYSGFKSAIADRKSLSCFEASAVCLSDEEFGELKLIVPCERDDYDSLVDRLQHAEAVRIEGMLVDASSMKGGHWENYFVVQRYEIVPQDFTGAEQVLSVVNDWRELIPMRHHSSMDPLFPETTSLAMMASALFVRRSVPAFNTIFFGPSNHGKTSVLRYLTEEVLGGSFESATGSAGKGWLISHKEGAPPSKMFTTRTAFLVDEMMKAVSGSGKDVHHSYAVNLKNFMMNHMQILEHDEVDASSGVGRIKGMMTCAFIGTENDDETLIRALGRAELLSEAVIRRIQIGYAERDVSDVDEFEDVNKALGAKKMTAFFCGRFGRDALKNIRKLYMYSRKFTEDVSIEAPGPWKKKMHELLLSEAKAGIEGYVNWVAEFSPGMPKRNPRLEAKFMSLLKLHRSVMTPCYVSAAIFRGWEVHKTLADLKPVFDDRQEKMAEDLVKFFFKSKLRILSKGIEEGLSDAGSGVERTKFGGESKWSGY